MCGERQDLGPDQQVSGQQGDFEPELILVEAVKRQVGQAGVFEVADTVLGTSTLTVPNFQIGDRPAWGVGRKTGDPPPVVVGQAQLGAGMGPFTASDDPHPCRPAAQCVGQVAGQLGDLGTLARCAIAVEGSPPRLGRHPIEGFDDRGHAVEPDAVLQFQVGDVVQEVFDPTAGVSPYQDLGTLMVGKLRQGGVQDADVVGCTVGPG